MLTKVVNICFFLKIKGSLLKRTRMNQQSSPRISKINMMFPEKGPSLKERVVFQLPTIPFEGRAPPKLSGEYLSCELTPFEPRGKNKLWHSLKSCLFNGSLQWFVIISENLHITGWFNPLHKLQFFFFDTAQVNSLPFFVGSSSI